MSLFLAIFLVLILIVTTSLFLRTVWRAIREQARLRRALDISVLQVLLPKDLKQDEKEEGIGDNIKERISIAEQFLSTLVGLPTKVWDKVIYGRPIIVFEIVAREDGTIVFYAGTERRYLSHLEKQIYAFYPDAEVAEAKEYTIFEQADDIKTGVLSLSKKQHLPIATYKELEVDPMQSITGALAKIQDKDAAIVQFICRPASAKTRRKGRLAAKRTTLGKQSDVAGSAAKAVFSGVSKSKESKEKEEMEAQKLTPGAQQRVEKVEQKTSQQQFDVNIRIGVGVRQPEESEMVFNAIAGAFSQYDSPDLNSLKLRTGINKKRFLRDLIFKVPRDRYVNTLSTTELASLFHFPLPTTGTPNILWRGSKIAPAPTDVPSEGILLGHNIYRGVDTPVHMTADDRRRHMYLIGQTGTGKTTLFLNMITQDIAAGHGVGVVDPHGDLIEDILLHIPPERVDDVILFDPQDIERPLGFNILEAKDQSQKDLIVNEVVLVLSKLAARMNPESVGPMFEHYLRNALLALVQDENSTLLDVPRMFVDEEFRGYILSLNPDPVVKQFWEQEFTQSQKGQTSADMLSYVISKLGRFMGNAVIRNIIGQSKSSFDIRDVMDNKKILLCNLSKGSLGDINSDLLGFVLVSKIQIAALSRSNIPESKRNDFYLYLDEFQNFTTDSIATILSEARKYHLDLNLTHQFIHQLDDKIREAVFGNIGTIISYRIGIEDTEVMAKQFDPVFSAYDLVNLQRFTASLKLLINGTPSKPFSLKIPPPPIGGNPNVQKEVRELSRQKYGRSKDIVEDQVLSRFNLGASNTDDVTDTKNIEEESDDINEALLDI